MKKLTLTIILGFLLSNAHAFTHFKLGKTLQEKYRRTQAQKGVFLESLSTSSGKSTEDIEVEIEKVLFGDAKTTKSNEAFKSSNFGVGEFQDSLLFKKITEHLQGNFERIGNQQVNNVLQHREQFGGGVENFSGFTWEKPTGFFSIGVNRQVKPDLHDSNRWIVHDTFVVSVNAETFLNKLAEGEMIEIDAGQIRAYAGVQFQRVYSTYHFADSYEDGLRSDFSKLFLSFLKFNPRSVMNLEPDNILKKEDYFSFAAGGIVTSPPVYGFSFSGGAHVAFSRTNKVTIQAISESDPKRDDEFLRVSQEKSKTRAVGVSASLQLDFFNLLKITLLTAEIEYEFEETVKHDLSFYNADKNELLSSSDKAKQFKKLVRGGKIDIDYFHGHIIQHEERMSQNFSSKYGAFIVGAMKKTDTEFIRVIKENESKTFFRHFSENMKVVQSFWSKIFSIVIHKILDFDIGVKNMSSIAKRIEMEYESPHDRNDMVVDDEEKFSIVLTQRFDAHRTEKRKHRYYNKRTRKYLGEITTLDGKYKDLVKNHQLRGPLSIESTIRIERDGLEKFHGYSDGQVFYLIAQNCDYENPTYWVNRQLRERLMREWEAGAHNCVVYTGRKYLDYIKDVRERGLMNLKKLKNFIGKFYKHNHDLNKLLDLFGRDKVFLHGSFEARTNSGQPFQTYFNQGEFKGLGVIDSYRRDGGISLID
jgi:hypothetical protein